MKYILDTHVWIWAATADHRLSATARDMLAALPETEKIGLAAISLKEAAWHLSRGRIIVTSGTWQTWLRDAAHAPQLDILPLTTEVAISSESFSDTFPADPADRLIAATALVHGLTLVTADGPIRASNEVRTLW